MESHKTTKKAPYVYSLGSDRSHFTTRVLFSLGQGLLPSKLRIADTEGKHNKRNRQADTCNAKQSLGMLVCENDIVAIRCADWVRRCEHQRLRVDLGGEGRVSKFVLQLGWENLVPNGTRDGIAERTSYVVRREVNSGHNGQVYLLG